MKMNILNSPPSLWNSRGFKRVELVLNILRNSLNKYGMEEIRQLYVLPSKITEKGGRIGVLFPERNIVFHVFFDNVYAQNISMIRSFLNAVNHKVYKQNRFFRENSIFFESSIKDPRFNFSIYYDALAKKYIFQNIQPIPEREASPIKKPIYVSPEIDSPTYKQPESVKSAVIENIDVKNVDLSGYNRGTQKGIVYVGEHLGKTLINNAGKIFSNAISIYEEWGDKLVNLVTNVASHSTITEQRDGLSIPFTQNQINPNQDISFRLDLYDVMKALKEFQIQLTSTILMPPKNKKKQTGILIKTLAIVQVKIKDLFNSTVNFDTLADLPFEISKNQTKVDPDLSSLSDISLSTFRESLYEILIDSHLILEILLNPNDLNDNIYDILSRLYEIYFRIDLIMKEIL